MSGIDQWVGLIRSAVHPYPKARTLPVISAWINRNSDVLGLTATTDKVHVSTDRMHGRIRFPGKGRSGVLLKVCQGPVVVFQHNSGQTYRYNFEVERWLADYIHTMDSATRNRIEVPK